MKKSVRAASSSVQFRGAATTAALFFALTSTALAPTAALAKRLDGVVEQSRNGDIVFAMDRKGKEIGHHSITYTPLADGRLQVDVAINIKVKFAFITAYRYEHKNREIWSADGQTLLSIDTQTFDNGRNIAVRGERTGDVFRMTDEDGTQFTIEGSIAPTSYWNPLLLSQSVSVLNTQKGKLADVRFLPVKDGGVALPEGETTQTQVYESQGELKNVFTDYTPSDSCFVGLEFLPPRQDVKISYRLESYFAQKREDLTAFPRLEACQSVFDKEAASPQGATYQLSGDAQRVTDGRS